MCGLSPWHLQAILGMSWIKYFTRNGDTPCHELNKVSHMNGVMSWIKFFKWCIAYLVMSCLSYFTSGVKHLVNWHKSWRVQWVGWSFSHTLSWAAYNSLIWRVIHFVMTWISCSYDKMTHLDMSWIKCFFTLGWHILYDVDKAAYMRGGMS